VRKGDDLTSFIVPKVKKIRSLKLPDPLGPPRPVEGHLYLYWSLLTIPESLRSKGMVCGRSPAGIAGSNPAGARMFVLCVLHSEDERQKSGQRKKYG
jgi:hypothetical protein